MNGGCILSLQTSIPAISQYLSPVTGYHSEVAVAVVLAPLPDTFGLNCFRSNLLHGENPLSPLLMRPLVVATGILS